MKINEIYTPEFIEKNKERLNEWIFLLPMVKAAIPLVLKGAAAVKTAMGAGAGAAAVKGGVVGAGKAALGKGVVSTGIKSLVKKGAQNIGKMGVQGSKNTNQLAHMRALTGGSKIAKKVKQVGNKLNQAPAGADSEAGKFVKDLVSNPTGGPVDAPANQVAQQPTPGLSPETGAAIANVQQAQVGGRAGIAQRRRAKQTAKA